ncbi:MAG TPA: DUF4340 domain-containing protein, partial [Polyangiaceae bacterium]|nr:DUF4340 domain-containing protein [Polyangiaceae bacterium]
AELEGEGTFVIGRDLATELTRSPDAYRGRTIVPYLASALSAIELTGAGAHRRLVRAAGGGGWSLVRGDAKVLVDRDASNRLLSALAEVRAEAFPSEIEGERALAEASSKVRLTLVPQEPAGPRAVIDIGGACPGHPEDVVAVRSEPAPKMVACVPQGVVPALSVSAEQLIDLHLFALRPDEMEEIELVAGEKKIDIVRAGPAWHMRAPTEGNVDNDVGQLFARSLHDVVAEAIVAPGTPGIGLDRVRATAKIGKVDGGDDPSAFEKVEAGPEMGDGFVYVRRATDGAILKVASEAARALVPQSSSLRSRKIIDEATSRVRGVVIDGPAVQQTLRRTPNGGYSLEAPKGFAVDPGLANDVAEALAQLKAERFAADADDGSFAFARPRAKYRLELEGPKVIDVETGRSTADGVFARRVGDPAVFVLPQATVRVLDTWAVDRSYFMLDPREVRQVKIERGTERVTLVAPSGKDAGPGAQRFDIVRNAFAAARTEGVLHLGPPRKDEGFDAPLMVLVITKGAEGSSETKVVRFAIGRGDVWRDTSVFYLRREGVDATFVMAQSKLRPLLDAK